MKNKNVRLKEIASELNLSINSVSRALRDCSDISESTKNLVIQKAIELGYMPNIIAQSLKDEGIKSVALLINNFRNLFFISMYQELADQFAKNNYNFTIIYSREKKVSKDIIKQCITQRVDAIISFFDYSKDSIQYAKYNNIVPIFLGKSKNNKDVSQVYTVDIGGGMLAANYLLNCYDINHYIYIGYKENQNSIDRFAAFKQTILERKPNAIVENIDFYEKTFNEEQRIIELVNKGELGVFGFNDELVYDILKKMNTIIPSFRKVFPNFHIIGFDSLYNKINGLMDLTSIDFDFSLMSRECINILNDYFFKGDNKPRCVLIPTTLHRRIY